MKNFPQDFLEVAEVGAGEYLVLSVQVAFQETWVMLNLELESPA